MGPIRTIQQGISVAAILMLAGCSYTTTWHSEDPPPPISPTSTAAAQSGPQATQPQAAPTDAPQDDPVLATLNAGMESDTPFNSNPEFIGSPTANDGQQPARFVGVMNLYGEMPGTANQLPDGTLDNLRQVTFTGEGADFDVRLSPDGNWLIYASTQHRPTSDIYMKQVNGSTVTQVTSDPGNDTMPALSPDGKMVAFTSDRSGSWDIYIQSLDGGQAIQLTDSPAQEIHPSWSPDAGQVVFAALSPQSGQWEIATVDVSNPANRRFLTYGLFPEFSPDGTKIAFQRPRFRGTRWFSVWTVDLVNGEAVRPTQIAASSNAAAITPSWSPDGKQLAFATVVNPTTDDPNRRPPSADVWVINVDGTGRSRLTNDTYVNLQPCWSPDGRVFFVSNRGGSDNIWAVRPSAPGSVIARQQQQPQTQPDAQTQAHTPAQPDTEAQASVPTGEK